MTTPTLEALLEVAQSREEFLGVYVFGSRGRNFMVDERSDRDVCVVLADREARREGFGDVIDGWQPDVGWLRGDAGYRDAGGP